MAHERVEIDPPWAGKRVIRRTCVRVEKWCRARSVTNAEERAVTFDAGVARRDFRGPINDLGAMAARCALKLKHNH